MYEAGNISQNINVNPCDILSAGIDMLSEWTDGRTDTSANWWHRNRYTVSIKGDTPVGQDEEDDEEAKKERKEREEKEKKRSRGGFRSGDIGGTIYKPLVRVSVHGWEYIIG